MLFVEDVISDFASRVERAKDPIGYLLRQDDWTHNFVLSLGLAIAEGRTLSSQQAKVFLRTIERHQHQIALAGITGYSDYQIADFLAAPRYRKQPYLSTVMPNEVRYLGDNKVGFRFKRNDAILEDLRKMRYKGRPPEWRDVNPVFDYPNKMWVVPVTRETIKPITQMVADHRFGFDDAFVEYLLLAENSRRAKSSFVYDAESNQFVINICDSEILVAWVKHVLFGEMV